MDRRKRKRCGIHTYKYISCTSYERIACDVSQTRNICSAWSRRFAASQSSQFRFYISTRSQPPTIWTTIERWAIGETFKHGRIAVDGRQWMLSVNKKFYRIRRLTSFLTEQNKLTGQISQSGRAEKVRSNFETHDLYLDWARTSRVDCRMKLKCNRNVIESKSLVTHLRTYCDIISSILLVKQNGDIHVFFQRLRFARRNTYFQYFCMGASPTFYCKIDSIISSRNGVCVFLAPIIYFRPLRLSFHLLKTLHVNSETRFYECGHDTCVARSIRILHANASDFALPHVHSERNGKIEVE